MFPQSPAIMGIFQSLFTKNLLYSKFRTFSFSIQGKNYKSVLLQNMVSSPKKG